MSALKRFLEWVRLKSRLHHFDLNRPEFSEKEIWWCYIGENIGSEISGKGQHFVRPVLVFRKLSKNLFLGIPTSTQKQRNKYWSVQIVIKDTKTSLILSQIRVLDSKRLKLRMGSIDDVTYNNVKRALGRLFL